MIRYMPTLEDEAKTIEPDEVEIGCGQAEVEKYWALATSPVSYANLHKWLRVFNSEASTERVFSRMRPTHYHHRVAPQSLDE